MRIANILAAAALAAALSSAIAQAAPVAMVTDLQGAGASAGKTKLTLMAYLEPGIEIELAPATKLTLTYFAKAVEETFTGPAKIRLATDKAEVLQGAAAQVRRLDAERVAAAKKFESAARERMAVATFVMRSAPAGIALLGPSDTKLAVTRPEFAWQPYQGERDYKLTLMDATGKVLQERAVQGTSWTPQEALQYGRSYQWKVARAAGGTESSPASFALVDEGSAARIARQKPAADAPFSERLLYAAELETEGLKYEALRQWRALAAERPQEAVLQKWIR